MHFHRIICCHELLSFPFNKVYETVKLECLIARFAAKTRGVSIVRYSERLGSKSKLVARMPFCPSVQLVTS